MNGSITWELWRACAKRLVLRRGWMPKTANRQQVSVGTATTAMILNGLGFSNRQLYLVPQFFANKPVEHLLGKGITAEMLNDDCLGRTLDWLYAHDLTRLFAGIASQARLGFGIKAEQVHVDTTSFSVRREKTQRSSPSPMAIRVTIVPISSSGCWHWRRRMMATCRCSYSRWMATAVIR